MNDKKFLGTFLGAAVLTVIASALYLSTEGVTDDNIRLMLRLSARLSFVLLLVIFVARPLRQLFRTPFTQSLLKNRPLLGVTFAGVHTGHLALLIYRAQQATEFELNLSINVAGALVYVIIFAMLITTFSGPRRSIGPKAWRILHKTGLYVLIVAFVQTQLPRSLDGLSGINWWLSALIVVALIIRTTAFFAKRKARS